MEVDGRLYGCRWRNVHLLPWRLPCTPVCFHRSFHLLPPTCTNFRGNFHETKLLPRKLVEASMEVNGYSRGSTHKKTNSVKACHRSYLPLKYHTSTVYIYTFVGLFIGWTSHLVIIVQQLGGELSQPNKKHKRTDFTVLFINLIHQSSYKRASQTQRQNSVNYRTTPTTPPTNNIPLLSHARQRKGVV